MRNRRFCLLTLLLAISLQLVAQKDTYRLRIRIEGINDTVVYMANHYGNKQYIKDTIVPDNKGWIVFAPKELPDQGVYILASQDKRQYFELIVADDTQVTLETKLDDLIGSMKVKGSPENQLWFSYLQFIAEKEKVVRPLRELLQAADENGNKDSVELLREKMLVIDKEVNDYKRNVYEKNPKAFVGKIFKAMEEVNAPDDPEKEAADSLYKFRYYKNHYWDNIDWTDDRLLRSPIFHKKLDFYFERLVPKIPDSINAAADIVVNLARQNKEMFKYTVFHLTTTYERSKVMGMDAVFVHMVDNYYSGDQAFWVDSIQLFRIRDKANSMKPVLLGKIAPNLMMIDTVGINIMEELGVLGHTSSEEATRSYMEHINTINTLTISLHAVPAKYTILLFWDPDCGHCRTMAGKLKEAYTSMREKKMDVKVYAVDTQNNYAKWKDYILKHDLNWINVTDPYHRNDLHTRYDINSTPVIFVLNEKKEIIAKRLGAEQIEDFLNMYEEVEARKRENK